MPATDRTGERSSAGLNQRRAWTPDDVRALGMTTDLETAAEIIGIGRTLAYDLAKNQAFPVRLLRLGRRVVVPVTELLQVLGCDLANGASDPVHRVR
jgi:predicted DNA-binding transcriptional regulator AlpA